jgi:hypothetical protein
MADYPDDLWQVEFLRRSRRPADAGPEPDSYTVPGTRVRLLFDEEHFGRGVARAGETGFVRRSPIGLRHDEAGGGMDVEVVFADARRFPARQIDAAGRARMDGGTFVVEDTNDYLIIRSTRLEIVGAAT